MASGEVPPYHQGCTLLVFGTPAAGKSSLITRLTGMWLRAHGPLDISVVSDNGLLRNLERAGKVGSSRIPLDQAEFRLSPVMRKSIAAHTIKDVVAESLPRRIAVLELATFDWQAVQENLCLPEGRKSYAIYLRCSREVSLQRQHDRAHAGVFNATLPAYVLASFLAAEPPREWLASQLDSYWEFDTGVTSIEEILAGVGELEEYGAKNLSHLYDLGDASGAARVSIEHAVGS